MVEILEISKMDGESLTHIAKGIGKETSSFDLMERDLTSEDRSSADSAGGCLSRRPLRWVLSLCLPMSHSTRISQLCVGE